MVSRPAPRGRVLPLVRAREKPAKRKSAVAENSRRVERKEAKTARSLRIRKPERIAGKRGHRGLGRALPVATHPRKAVSRRAVPVKSVVVAAGQNYEESSGNVRDQYLAREQTESPATPVPVVSLIRPVEDRPQLLSPQEEAAMPAILPSLYDKRGRLVMPAALKGSHEILVHQNEMADRDRLARVQDDDDLSAMRKKAMLVALPVNSGMQVDERLPANRRYCRPWTANFLAVLARAHYARFHTALQVNSAVRTVDVQQRLLRTNGNAAPIAGETASPHLTGQAVDIAKRGLSLSEIAWMRGYLLPFIEEGKIDVEEEFQQSCFHVSVYKKFVPAGPALDEIAVTHRDRPAALAIMLH